MIESFLQWLTSWTSTFVVWTPDVNEAGRVLAACTTLMAMVQAIKRVIEWVERNPVLAKILPKELRNAIGLLAHGYGAVVLAGITSIVVMVPTVVADGSVTLAEIINVIMAFGGAIGLYEVLRGKIGLLFPKRQEIIMVEKQ